MLKEKYCEGFSRKCGGHDKGEYFSVLRLPAWRVTVPDVFSMRAILDSSLIRPTLDCGFPEKDI